MVYCAERAPITNTEMLVKMVATRQSTATTTERKNDHEKSSCELRSFLIHEPPTPAAPAWNRAEKEM